MRSPCLSNGSWCDRAAEHGGAHWFVWWRGAQRTLDRRLLAELANDYGVDGDSLTAHGGGNDR